MEGKTSKPSFNKAGGADKPKVTRNYSHKELVSKIDGYASVAKTGEQKKTMQKMKDDFEKDQNTKAGTRALRNQNYRLGMRANIHQTETIKNLEKGDAQKDQDDRNKTVAKAKEYYHRNYSVTKAFKETKVRTKTKDKTIDKG